MKLETTMSQGAYIIRLEGELDLSSVPEFRAVIDQALEKQKNYFILNLEKLQFIDSSGLGTILALYKKTQLAGGKLIMTGLQPPVEKVLSLSGLLKIISVQSSESDALQQF